MDIILFTTNLRSSFYKSTRKLIKCFCALSMYHLVVFSLVHDIQFYVVDSFLFIKVTSNS